MGIEYQFRFATPNAAAVAEVLRRLPAAREVTPAGLRFEIGTPGEGSPQATVQAEPGGVYYCDHCGGVGRALLGDVLARLVAAFGPVTVEEL